LLFSGLPQAVLKTSREADHAPSGVHQEQNADGIEKALQRFAAKRQK
jgi:hypothetical protein